MGGVFSKTSRPKLAGSYFNFEISALPTIPPSIGRTVALVFTHDWGPLEKVQTIDSFADFIATFGGNPAAPTSGYIAAYEAFKGEGTPDGGGAGRVLAYRIGGASAAKATKVLQNTTPATAITVSAKYEGSRGNSLRLTTQDHAADATQNELIVLEGSTVLETYVYTDTNIADLVAQINATSSFITATLGITGVALTAVTSQALTGGDDGVTLVSGDYTQAMSALETQKFGVLTFENLTDAPTLASVTAWTIAQNAAGRRFFLVVGGALNETITTAVARSATLNDPNIVNVGVGSVSDRDLLTSAGLPTTLSTAQLAPRIAGIVANRGERMALTFAKLVGLDLPVGPSTSDILRAYDTGVVVLGRASDREATVRLEKGLTSFVTKTDAARPWAIFSQPKYVAVMHGLQEDLVEWANDNIIGRTTVDQETRQAVLAQINVFMRQREELGAVQAGWVAMVDPNPPPSDDDPFIAFVISAKFGRSVEQVYFTGRLG